VLIFQHASYRNREDMFAVADSFADNGFVVAGIDLPLHGITNPADPFYATAANPLYAGLGLPANGSIERTFDLALISPPTIDPTGSHYLNLTSLLTSRDNVREAVADLITFERTLPSLNLGAAGTIDASAMHFLGHSEGALRGAVFLAVVPSTEVSTGTLANAGGYYSQLLVNSPSFAPQVNGGLAAAGIPAGSTLYWQFFRDAQTVVDSGDPINFIGLATAQHPLHLLQVIGSTPQPPNCTPVAPPQGCTDQVVPNISTQALITASSYGPAAAAGTLTRIARPATPGLITPNASGYRAYVSFINGDHGSIIDNVVPGVTAEMQGEAISFALASGQDMLITNPAVIEP